MERARKKKEIQDKHIQDQCDGIISEVKKAAEPSIQIKDLPF